MKLTSKEHYDLMLMFEREFAGTARLDREKDKELWKKGQVYESGETNKLFLAYRKGYSFGKFIN